MSTYYVGGNNDLIQFDGDRNYIYEYKIKRLGTSDVFFTHRRHNIEIFLEGSGVTFDVIKYNYI